MLSPLLAYTFFFLDDEHDAADLLATRTRQTQRRASSNSFQATLRVQKIYHQITDLRVRLPSVQCRVAQFLSPTVDFIVHARSLPSTAKVHASLPSSSQHQSKPPLLLSLQGNNEGVSIVSGVSGVSGVGVGVGDVGTIGTGAGAHQRSSRTSSRSQRILGSATKRASHLLYSTPITAAGASDILMQHVLEYVQARETLLQENNERPESNHVTQGVDMGYRIASDTSSQKDWIATAFGDHQRHRREARLPPRLVIGDEHGRPIPELGATFAREQHYYTAKKCNTLKRPRGVLKGVNQEEEEQSNDSETPVIVRGRRNSGQNSRERLTHRHTNTTTTNNTTTLSSSSSSSTTTSDATPTPRLDRTLLSNHSVRPAKQRHKRSASHELLGGDHMRVSYLHPMLESNEPAHKMPIQRPLNAGFTPRAFCSKKSPSGYCFCCCIHYKSLDNHISSRKHKMYHTNDGNFVELENFLASVYSGKPRALESNSSSSSSSNSSSSNSSSNNSNSSSSIRSANKLASNSTSVTFVDSNSNIVSKNSPAAKKNTAEERRSTPETLTKKRAARNGPIAVVTKKSTIRTSVRHRATPEMYNPSMLTRDTYFAGTFAGCMPIAPVAPEEPAPKKLHTKGSQKTKSVKKRKTSKKNGEPAPKKLHTKGSQKTKSDKKRKTSKKSVVQRVSKRPKKMPRFLVPSAPNGCRYFDDSKEYKLVI